MACLTFKKVRTAAEASPDSIQTTLFRDPSGPVRGWYIGPVSFRDRGLHLPYLARSEGVIASVAIVRAVEAARVTNVPVCIIDPDDLWDPAWGR